MLESGIDRIISQVVDPKINHTFRPQVEKAVHEFLATLNHKEEASGSMAPDEEKPDSSAVIQGVPAPGPSANVANDAMSILETITSLNQEASAARASTETANAKTSERVSKKLPSQPSTDTTTEREKTSEDVADKEKSPPDSAGEGQEAAPKSEELSDLPCPVEEIKNHTKESNSSLLLNKDVQQESSDQKNKSTDKGEKKPDSNEKGERKKEKKEKPEKKFDHSKRSEDIQKVKEEKQAKDKEVECSKLPSEKNSNKAKEGTKEDCSAIESDVDGLTDITVSSVHTSDLSSFEEDTEEEVVMSDSMEEGEITSDDEEKNKQNKTKAQTSEPSEGKAKTVRHAYVHKPYLYSKYYSDSDDELTVEQRRQSIAKEKEERLLRRQINREKLEEKRKQKAEKTKSSKVKSQGKNSVDLEDSSAKSLEPKAPRIKEVLKERKVLEKKVALSKKRKKDSRNVEENSKKKQQAEEDSKETLKTSEHCEKEKVSTSKDSKHVHAKSEPSKPTRRLSESLHSADENKNESKLEREHKRRTSTPVVVEGAQEETDARDGKRPAERSDAGSEEPQKQKSSVKNEKHLKKDDSETPHVKNPPKKEAKSSKEKPEKEKTLSEDKVSVKHKHKGDSAHKTGDEAELHPAERGLKVDESIQKPSPQTKPSADEKAERKSKHRNERKLSVLGKDGKPVSEYIIKTDENVRKENNKKERHLSTEKTKAEHKSRRSSDSKIQKDSLSSKQHGITLQRRSDSYSEGKCDTDSTNADNNSKPEDVHKEKRRTKSLTEEKLVLKSKSKSQGKQLRVVDTELQEGVTKQTATPKPEKEKITEENDLERPRKSKVEDKSSEETGFEPGSESAASSAHSTQKDAGHRAKLPLAKEKHKGEKDASSSRLERKLSDGHKSRSLKHSSKDVKKKEENKSDDKDGREGDSNHEKARGNSSATEKKLSRRLCENRRGSSSQEMTKGEEKAANALATPSTSSLQRPKKSGDATSIPEPEPMEVDSEPAVENVPEGCKAQESSSDGPPPDTDSENATKNPAATALRDESRTSPVDTKPAAPASKSGRGTGLIGNSEKHADHKSALTKKAHVQSAASKADAGEKEPTQQGAREASVDSAAGQKVEPRALSESDRAPRTSKHTRATEECVTQRDAVLEHSTDLEPSPSPSAATAAPQTQSQDSGGVPGGDRGTVLEGGTASALLADHTNSPNQSLTVREPEVPRTSDSREGGAVSTADAPAKAGLGSKRHIPEGSQAATVHSALGKVNVPLGAELTDTVTENECVSREGGSKDMGRKESGLSTEPTAKQAVRTAAQSGRKDGIAVDHVVGVSTKEDAETVEAKLSHGPGEAENASCAVGRRDEDSEVDTSAGGSAAASVPPQRGRRTGTVTAASGSAEKTSITTSTEGEDAGTCLNLGKAGNATATSSEAGEGAAAVPCTSIEADEGLVTGARARHTRPRVAAEASECTVFAAAEEGGAVVTEGLADSEPFLTSTKEGESGECAVAESEGRAAEPATAQAGAAGDRATSAATDEKDDAVTSAGSEEKCGGSSSGDAELGGRTVAFASEGESDGAVTSAGTEIHEASLSSEELDGFRRDVARTGPKKDPEGTVTCTAAARGSDGFATCAVTGAGPQAERAVTGAAAALLDTGAPPGAGAPQGGDGSANDGAEGESAVTSTGITEEDGERPASCSGSEDGGDGCARGAESEDSGESAMDSTVAEEATNAPSAAAGPCDDEGVVTSTGAKEEDDEGEGVVTSTGRGNEVGPAAAGAGAEEEGEGAPVCGSAEAGDARVGTAAALAAAEAGAAAAGALEGGVDSRSGAARGKDAEAEICSSAKGLVESSVTGAAAPAAREGPGASAAAALGDSQLARKDKAGGSTTSPGLVGGSGDGLVTAAALECEARRSSPGGKEDEGVITSVENEECDGLAATTASGADQTRAAAGGSRGAGLLIPTSTAGDGARQPGAAGDTGAARTAALPTEETAGSATADAEDFEAPMPSAGAGGEDKDECALISTSIGDLDVPVSSAATVTCAGSQQPAAAVEARATGPSSPSADDFEGPTPSADADRPRASTSKDDRDECALISTSIAEGCEASISGAAAESEDERSLTVLEEKDGSAIISTSSGEDCEGPVSSAAPRQELRPSVTPAEEISDTAMISTSTSEGREAAMRGAAPHDDDQPTATRTEDSSDTAIISTSTAECAPTVTGLHGHEESRRAASNPEGRDGPAAAKDGKGEVPLPSPPAENCPQRPGPSAGEGPFGAPSAGAGQLEDGSASLSSVQRKEKSHEAGVARDSTAAPCSAGRGLESTADSPASRRGPEQTSGHTAEGSVHVRSLTAVSTGAKVASDAPHGKDAAAAQPSLPAGQRGPEGSAKATASECANGQESDFAPPHPAPPAAGAAAPPAPRCEQGVTGPADHGGGGCTAQVSTEETGGGLRKTFPKDGDPEGTVSSEENAGDIGNEESPSDILGGLEPKANLETETFVPSEEEKNHEILGPSESSCGRQPVGTAELQKEPSPVRESLSVENPGSGTSEEIHSISNKEELSNGSKENTGAGRGHSVEANPKETEEEERHVPKRKRKKHYPSSEDELDDNLDVLDSRTEAAQRPCSETEPREAKEENSGDSEEPSKPSPNANSTASRAMEEKDGYSSSGPAGDKAEQNDEDNVKSQEEDHPVIIKRKRGRPRKHPVETALKTKEDCKTDTGTGTVEQSPPGGKPKVMQTDESNKDTGIPQERVSNDDGEEKTVAGMRRRGRKPKRSLTSSDDAESSEPERKRQKSVSEATEDKKDQESEEEEEEEEDDEPAGATTRSATRSEAQRSKAQLSPSMKRKREASPPGARTRGQQRVEEAPAKKAKRQC
ncbi:biorientation of chromosomes in cell division protein 1-like 1 isoform X2 [Rousettus aegyptiacus]|nr:biorientation of chromosomes in cell division protein 1-like 1 isoform X2 [Rousettus aegyptiacus]